jgi:tRNA(Ile)-lysidine synthetase-like protein
MKLNLDKNKKYVVAFSGGSDSVYLTHQLQTKKFDFRLIHVKHPNSKASTSANEIEAFCLSFAKERNIDITILDMSLDSEKIKDFGTEAAERESRYSAILNSLSSEEILLTGHHLDDQIENVLFRLFRGTSVNGLRGIMSSNRIIRPLQHVKKSEITNYLTSVCIIYRYDFTNNNNEMSRNFIRNKIIPLVCEHFGESKVYSSIKRLIENMRDTSGLLEDLYQIDYQTLMVNASGIDLVSFSTLLDERRQRNFLYHYIVETTKKFPTSSVIEECRKRFANYVTSGKKRDIMFIIGGFVSIKIFSQENNKLLFKVEHAIE